MNLQHRKIIDLENELMLAGGKDGGDSQGVWDGHVHTAIFKMTKQQGPTVQHRELCSMLCGSLHERGVGENGHMHMNG